VHHVGSFVSSRVMNVYSEALCEVMLTQRGTKTRVKMLTRQIKR